MNEDPSKQRWRLLRDCVTKRFVTANKSLNCLNSADVFGLFDITLVNESTTAVLWRLSPRTSSEVKSPQSLLLGIPKIPPRLCTLEELVGFDRTGVAVSIWPCELLLAHMFLSRLDFPQLSLLPPTCQRVVELAAGSLGVGGLAMASAYAEIEYLALTDGNEDCVRSLRGVLKIWPRKRNFEVETAILRWTESVDEEPNLPEDHADWRNSFDVVIAADCFYFSSFTATHGGLLRCIDCLLSNRPGSLFLALAPRRGATLKAFVDLASSVEVCERFRWTVRLLPPSVAFPRLSGDPEKMIPHLVCLQRQ